MAGRLRLRVWSPAETVAKVDDVQWVHVDLRQARPLTVWPGHAPLLAETAQGELAYADDRGTHTIHLPAGILQMRDDELLILIGGPLQAPDGKGGAHLDRLIDVSLADLDRSR